MRYFISLSFNGSAFCGWQIQNNAISVQEQLQNALSTLLKEEIKVTGAGRTDTGVNAMNYVAHFDTIQPIAFEPAYFCYKLNAILSKEITILAISRVKNDAHARFDADQRCYRYYIHTYKDPFTLQFSHFVSARNLDIDAMNQAARYFLGQQDFSSLEKLRGGSSSSICTVTKAVWMPLQSDMELQTGPASVSPSANIGNPPYSPAQRYVFEVRANRFLRNMVRAMVGSLLEVGTGRRNPEWIKEMLAAHNRCAAGTSVPGNALFLCGIHYPYEIHWNQL